MDDDFNAANGMTVLYQWLKEWNVYLEQEVVSKAVLEALLEKATVLFGIFGMLIWFVGLAFSFIIFAFTTMDSQREANKYGESPKYVTQNITD